MNICYDLNREFQPETMTTTRLLTTDCKGHVDDILVIYDSTLTTPDSIQRYLSTIHNNIQLNPTHENNLSVSFLDLKITRKPSHLDIGIHRKPTTTDTTTNFLSNLPSRHKLAAYQFLIRRMLTLPIHKEKRREE